MDLMRQGRAKPPKIDNHTRSPQKFLWNMLQLPVSDSLASTQSCFYLLHLSIQNKIHSKKRAFQTKIKWGIRKKKNKFVRAIAIYCKSLFFNTKNTLLTYYSERATFWNSTNLHSTQIIRCLKHVHFHNVNHSHLNYNI